MKNIVYFCECCNKNTPKRELSSRIKDFDWRYDLKYDDLLKEIRTMSKKTIKNRHAIINEKIKLEKTKHLLCKVCRVMISYGMYNKKRRK